MKKTKQRTIKTALVMIMILLVAVPLVIQTIVSVKNTMSAGTDNAYEVNAAQASIVEERINDIMATNLEAIKIFAAAPSTLAYLKGEAATEADGQAIIAQLQTIDETLADGNSTALAGADGMQVLRSTGNLVDVSDREYYKEAMQGHTFISDMNISKTTGKCISTFAVPVFDTDKKTVIGMVQRNYDLSVLHDLLAEEVTQNRQEIVMVDRTGTVVAHSLRELNVEDPEKQDQNPFYTDSRGDKTYGEYTSDFMGDTWIISWIKLDVCGWVVASCRVKEEALKAAYSTLIIQILITVVFMVAGAVVALIYSKRIADPLHDVDESIAALSNGEFANVPPVDRNDEVGRTMDSTKKVVDTLKDIVSNIKSEASTMDSASVQLANMSSQMSQVTSDVANSVQEIAEGAVKQAGELQNARGNVDGITRAVADVENATTELESITARMKEASDDSAESLSMLGDTSTQMNNAIEDVSDKIASTSASVKDIEELVSKITAIAAQTNLLALNASIEAARAGDAGRGFAVVAEEIGALATDSTASAEDIRRRMDALLKESEEAVAIAENVKKTNLEQQEVISRTRDSVNVMISDVSVSVDKVSDISRAAKEVAVAKDAVTDVIDSISEISENNAASSEETGASMEELSATVQTLASNAADLKELSNRLTEQIAFFKE